MNVTPNERLLAANLRKIRELRGLDQAAVAKHLGCSQGMVSAMEACRRHIGVRHLLGMMRLYNASFTNVVCGKLERPTPPDHSACTPGSEKMCRECAKLWNEALLQ